MNGHHRIARAAVVALALVLAAACGSSTNPAAPSGGAGPSTAASTPGATISGTVNGTTSAASGGTRALDATNGITVTISGTGLSVAADSQGRFTLTGVPAGSVQLVFSGNGPTATVTLNGVQATDKIVVKVTVRGGAATLESEQRNGSGMTELEDRITAVNPQGTTRTLDVGSTRVSVPDVAIVRHGNDAIEFGALHVGDRVHVRGSQAGALLVASEVMVQNTNAKVPVNASGAVSALEAGSACPAIRFTVANWVVETSAATDFQKGKCDTIANGTTVHVKGDVQESGRVLASWVQIGK